MKWCIQLLSLLCKITGYFWVIALNTLQLVGWVVKTHHSIIGKLFFCNIQCLYTTTLCNLTFTNVYTSCTHPCKINYPCMLGITSTLSNLPRYLKLLSNYEENGKELDLKLQRKSFTHLLLEKVNNKQGRSGLFRPVVMSHPLFGLTEP